jgi:L-cysteine desulfidase
MKNTKKTTFGEEISFYLDGIGAGNGIITIDSEGGRSCIMHDEEHNEVVIIQECNEGEAKTLFLYDNEINALREILK